MKKNQPETVVEAPAGEAAASSGASNGSTTGATIDELLKGAATIGAIGVGVALIETALIPGMLIGVAAALAPKYLPKLGEQVQPALRTAVRGIYKLNRKTREAVAEAHERVQDIVAEVHAEKVAPSSEAPTHAAN